MEQISLELQVQCRFLKLEPFKFLIFLIFVFSFARELPTQRSCCSQEYPHSKAIWGYLHVYFLFPKWHLQQAPCAINRLPQEENQIIGDKYIICEEQVKVKYIEKCSMSVK